VRVAVYCTFVAGHAAGRAAEQCVAGYGAGCVVGRCRLCLAGVAVCDAVCVAECVGVCVAVCVTGCGATWCRVYKFRCCSVCCRACCRV